MGKVAFTFPGVGVPFSGHEAAFLARNEPVMRPFLEEAGERVGVDLVEPLRAQDTSGLDVLACQVLTHAFDVAVAEACRARGVEPSMTAGYSLGIYPALVASGAVGFGEGLDFVECAYRRMKEVRPEPVWGLAVIIGLERDEVDAILRDALMRINTNNATSHVVSGSREALESLSARAAEAGAIKTVLLDVDLPYHHPGLLGDATPPFADDLRKASWRTARCPVVSSIDQRLLSTPESLVDLTARNISTPIDWQAVVRTMSANGVETVVECGAGISLTQNARLMEDPPSFVSVKTSLRRISV